MTITASSAPTHATDVAAAYDLLARVVREGSVPLPELTVSPVARAAARVLYERGLVTFEGGALEADYGAAGSLRAAQVAAGRFLVDLPLVARQD